MQRTTVIFFRFVQMANHLESIRVDGYGCGDDEFCLDIDLLDILKLQHLCSLRLHDITISSQSFLQIIEQNQRSLRAIELGWVELKDGTWEAILLRLCYLPCLLYFSVDHITYVEGLVLPTQASNFPRGWNYAGDITSDRLQDFYALGRLQRQIKANREAAGLCPSSDKDMKRIQLISDTAVGQ